MFIVTDLVSLNISEASSTSGSLLFDYTQNDYPQKDQNLGFKANYCLIQDKSIAEHSGILSTLSYQLLFRSFFRVAVLRRFYCTFISQLLSKYMQQTT